MPKSRAAPFTLGRRNAVALADVVSAIRTAPTALDTPDVAALLSIVIRPDEKEWSHLRTVLRLGEGQDLPEDHVVDSDLGSVRLLGVRLTPGEFETLADLTEYLTFWQPLIESRPRTFHDRPTVYWQSSRNRWSDWPCWRIELHDNEGSTGWNNEPRGPFFRPGLPFAADIADAARQWLKEPATRGDGVSQNSYSIIIPDHRTRLQALRMEGTSLQVTLQGRSFFQVFCAADASDVDGHRLTTEPVLVKGREVTVAFQRAIQSVSVYLFDAKGSLLDEYSESGAFSSWGRSILTPGRASGPLNKALQQARELGEGQQVEFKEWVSSSRSEVKSLEFLKTIVAFLNAEGGALYVGVDDDAHVVGVTPQLRRALGKKHGSDTDKMRDTYVTRLRRLIAEAVQPPAAPEFAWLEDSGHWVLRVSVSKNPDRPHYLAESSDFYIRRGATNRRMTREELQRALVQQNPM